MSEEGSQGGRGGRSILGIVFIGLGALLLTVALALVFVVVPAQKKTPLDSTSLSLTETVPGNVLRSSNFAAGEPLPQHAERPECAPAPPAEPENPDEPAPPEDPEAPEGPEGEPEEAPAEEAALPMTCFIDAGVPLYSQRYVQMVEPADSDVVTFQVATSLLRDDFDEGEDIESLVSATIDRVTMDRTTAEPVDEPTSTVEMISTGEGQDAPASAGFVREGLQYKFPFDTEQETYDYYDTGTFTSNPIEFVGESEVNGVPAYEFRQEIGPINMFESIRDHFAATEEGYSETAEAVLGSYRLADTTAGQWGLEGAPERAVQMDRFYTNDRRLWVSPETGQILNGQESQFQFFAEDQAEAEAFFSNPEAVAMEKENPHRTAVFFDAAWSEETQATAAAETQNNVDRLNTFGTTLPWILGVAGVLSLIVGVLFGVRGGRKD